MKKNQVFAVLSALAMFIAPISSPYAEEAESGTEILLYVSAEKGKDTQNATEEMPVKTIAKAKEIAKNYKDKKVTILVEQGDYYESIFFNKEDARSKEYPLTIKSRDNQHVRLIGAKKIDAGAAVNVSDSNVLNRIPEESRDKVLQINLKAQGIEEYGEIVPINFGQLSLAPPELFINNSAMTLARWPNGEYAKIESVVDKSEDSFTFTAQDAGDRVQKWANAKDVWAYGFWYWDWANAGMRLKKIDANSGAMTAESKEDVRAGQRFYVYNILEELDKPNEFYLDRETGILFFYPTGKITAADDVLLSLSTDAQLDFNNTGNIIIDGLEIGFTRGNGINAQDSDGITIENCKIWYTGQIGIQAEETVNLTVSGCTITETGAGGIKNTGGDYVTLTHSNNLFINNHIYKFSRIIKSYTPALRVEGVGARISNNLIHDEEHIAILYNGNDNIIEYNEIYNVCTSTDDSGAIYTGQRWNDRGNVVRYNYIHDVVGHEGSYGVSGVYLDDIHSSTEIYGNIFYNVARAVLVGGGRDNKIINNMILEAPNSSTASVVIDARGLEAWFQHNLDPDTGVVYEHLSKVPYKSEIWTEKYPELAVMFENEPKEPRGNVVKNNIIYNHKDLSIAGIAEKYGDVSNNLITDYEDIGFEDYEGKDFRLKDDSIVFEIIPDFQQIPIDKIGLLSDGDDDMELSPKLLDACAKYSDRLVLAINSGYALVKGDKAAVDSNSEIKVFQKDGAAYIPLRFAAEQLGYAVEYNQEKQEVSLIKGDENIVLSINEKFIEKNGERLTVSYSPIRDNGRIFVEIRSLKSVFRQNIYSDKTGIIVFGDVDEESSVKDLSYIRAYLLYNSEKRG